MTEAQLPAERVSPLLVGRDESLQLVGRRWKAVLQGQGHMLLVAGEAGIGKSRLLRESAGIIGPGVRIVDARAFPRDAEAPGGLILSISDGLRRAGMPGEALSLREHLLETDYEGDSARRRRVLIGDLADIVAGIFDETPTLIQVEDLHWADDLSLHVLEHLAPIIRASRVMVVATYRSDELHAGTGLGQWRSRLLERRAAEEVILRRLDLDDTTAMIEAILGQVSSAEFAAALQSRSDGIPLHIEELLAGGSVNAVPDTVADAVTARAGILPHSVRGVLDAASVVGRTFDIDMLESVLDQPPENIDFALGLLVDSHLLVPVDDDGTFVFRHALICDAIYSTIPPHRKRTMHAAVAAAAQRGGLSEAYVSEHFERAHEKAQAYRSALAGADEAVRVSAHREAAELFRRAQRTAPPDQTLPARALVHSRLAIELATIDDNDGAGANLEAAIGLYRELGDEASAASLVPRLMAARHLIGDRFEDRSALAYDALARLDRLPNDATPMLVRAELYAALAAACMLDRRLDEALDFGRRATTLLTERDPETTKLDVNLTLGSVLVFAGRGDEGWALLEESIARSARAHLEAETARGYRMLGTSASVLVEYDLAHRWIRAGLDFTASTQRWNDHHYLSAHLAHVNWARGEWDAAFTGARQAVIDGKGITTRIVALTVLGYVEFCRGDFAEARSHLAAALELGEAMREVQRVSPALWGLAEIALHEGTSDLAVELCERGFEESLRLADAAYLFPFVVTGARAYLALHDTQLARQWLSRCARLLHNREIGGTLPALEHAEGLIELSEGRTGTARVLLEHALVMWSQRQRFWEEAQTIIDLAHCAARSRRPAEAARLAARVNERGGAVRSALLVRWAGEVHSGAVEVGPLSPRELEVARLVASGLTNREIAARLVISPKTASTHVEHILSKLGANRRAEIATWVARMV